MATVLDPKPYAAPAWQQNPLIVGPLTGFVIGVLWWVGITIALSQQERDPDAVFDGVFMMAIYSSIISIPWAIVGLIVGGITRLVRGQWVPNAAIIGSLIGCGYSLADHPFNAKGEIIEPMAINFLSGALIGAIIGAVLRLALPFGKARVEVQQESH